LPTLTAVRLLDHIAQSRAPFLVRQQCGDLWQLTSPSDFARPVERCPLRYVLSDDLVRTCNALAYSEGDELSSCLDLLHLPAERLWVEWDEAARRDSLAWLLPECVAGADNGILRAGALICAHPRQRSGSLRTFWLTRAAPQQPLLAAVETLLDFDGPACDTAPETLLDGKAVAVRDPRNGQLDRLLQCAGFRLDAAWQRYYRSVTHDAVLRAEVARCSLAAVAFDVPMLLALFLLMAVRADLVQRPVSPVRLNAKRARLGKHALLEHIEVSSPVFAAARQRAADSVPSVRRAPRLHHVRGHIVRRRDVVYWRHPHWRGHVRLGSVRSRTVELQVPHCRATRAGRAPGARDSGD
jgi:hypothetical protein